MSEKYSAKTWTWAAVLILVGVLTRQTWLPHPPNFSAFLAIALFAGMVLPGPLALGVPILSLFLGDVFLGFHDLAWVVYLSLLPITWAGMHLPSLSRRASSWLSWVMAGVGSAMFFFVTTNLAVWWTSGMYTHDVGGLTSCFILAIPFFHNSILATLIYLGGFEAVRRLQPKFFSVPATAAK